MKSETATRLHGLLNQMNNGQMTRRRFLSQAGTVGLGGILGTSLARPTPAFATTTDGQWHPDKGGLEWAREVSTPYRGAKIRLATENTPPSMMLKQHLVQHFVEATGIEVEIEVTQLEQVLEKLIFSVATGTSEIDLFYVDQGWAAFASDVILDPRETLEALPDLAMPGYAISDFMPTLVDGISSYKDRQIGVPYDVPIFVTQYRRDIYEAFDFSAPSELEQYYQQSKAITDAMGPEVYGATGQMKHGHLALEADWTAWLWGHGGSIFDVEGRFAGNDAAGLEAMEYWTRLWKTMPPEVLDWTWNGQGRSMARGQAASMISWAEWFPHINASDESQVRGLIEVAPCPQPKALRSTADTAFGEVPGIGHQGGSSLGVSRHSENQMAAWIFMQWATSSDTQSLITYLSGGTSPTRSSVFNDPRLAPYLNPEDGSMRHLKVVEQTIEQDMGSEPDLKAWPELANQTIPVHLGDYFKGKYSSAEQMMNALAQQVDQIVGSQVSQ